MASIMKITFLERNDADDIAKKISDSVPMGIEIENTYAELRESSLSVNGLDTATLAALYKLSDACTYTFEDGAYVFVVRRSGKDFDLTDSYIRDAEDIVKPMPAIPDGTPLWSVSRYRVSGRTVSGNTGLVQYGLRPGGPHIPFRNRDIAYR